MCLVMLLTIKKMKQRVMINSHSYAVHRLGIPSATSLFKLPQTTKIQKITHGINPWFINLPWPSPFCMKARRVSIILFLFEECVKLMVISINFKFDIFFLSFFGIISTLYPSICRRFQPFSPSPLKTTERFLVLH